MTEPCDLTDTSCLLANPTDPNSPLNPNNPASPLYYQNHNQDSSPTPGDEPDDSTAPSGGLNGILPSLSG
ncbi:hypothetical protein [Nocardia sp. NBC_01327]|uniref:hypothetical protein n=1 Tax=Nocardia sp. NBC_01327 TaxID=2903593 RepID=UPI002E12B1DC|nr:hypothetical protein OG326_15555 [Nocardia sp. NBC_01327]